MNYVGQIIKKAHKQNYKVENIFFKQGKDVSPWYEQAFPCLNQTKIEEDVIEVNAFYRFPEIFNDILHPELMGYDDFKRYMFDLSIHLLAEFDLYKSLTKDDFCLLRIEHEIISGIYGEKYGCCYMRFCKAEQIKVLRCFYELLHTKESLGLFRKALTAIYPDVLLYQIKEEPQKLILYLGLKKTDQEQQKLDFLQDMFLPLEFQPRIFWDKHFGVCSVDATLVMDEIELV